MADPENLGHYWENGQTTSCEKFSKGFFESELSIVGGVSLFECPTCKKKYWTFQFT